MPAFDEARQAAAVALLGQGFRRSQVAARVGVTAQTIRMMIRQGLGADGQPMPGTFAEKVAEAEDAVIGTVENQLLEAAQRGEAWAITLFLKGKDRDTYGDKAAVVNVSNTTNTLVVEGTAEDRRRTIANLAAELDARRALTQGGEDIVDAELIT